MRGKERRDEREGREERAQKREKKRQKKYKPDEAEGQAVALDLSRGGAVLPVPEAPVLEVGVLEVVAARPGEGEDPAEVAKLVAVFKKNIVFFRSCEFLMLIFVPILSHSPALELLTR